MLIYYIFALLVFLLYFYRNVLCILVYCVLLTYGVINDDDENRSTDEQLFQLIKCSKCTNTCHALSLGR